MVIGTRWVDPLEVAYAPTWTNTVQLPPSLCPALQIDERFTGEAQSRVPQHTQCPPTTLQPLVPTHSHSWLVVDAIKLS